MKTKIAATLAVMAIPAAAIAQDVMIDTDGDGVVSYDELAVAYPDVTEDIYAVLDADGDGAVTQEEVMAATEAGIIMAPEG